MLKVIWRETALDDLDSIVEYISEFNSGAAYRLQSLFETSAERLPEHPFMHRAGRIPGTREAVVHPNYILVYKVGDDAVEILNVIHTRRRYPPEDS